MTLQIYCFSFCSHGWLGPLVMLPNQPVNTIEISELMMFLFFRRQSILLATWPQWADQWKWIWGLQPLQLLFRGYPGLWIPHPLPLLVPKQHQLLKKNLRYILSFSRSTKCWCVVLYLKGGKYYSDLFTLDLSFSCTSLWSAYQSCITVWVSKFLTFIQI